jgi:hypothetical protein
LPGNLPLPAARNSSLLFEKYLTMHRYIARFIGCVILCFVPLLLAFLAPRVVGSLGGRNQITVRTNGTTSDVIAAVEALKREDLSINTKRVDIPRGYAFGMAALSVMMAGALWVACGVVKHIEQSLSSPKRKEGNQFSAPKADP